MVLVVVCAYGLQADLSKDVNDKFRDEMSLLFSERDILLCLVVTRMVVWANEY